MCAHQDKKADCGCDSDPTWRDFTWYSWDSSHCSTGDLHFSACFSSIYTCQLLSFIKGAYSFDYFFSLPLSVINYVTLYATYSLRSQSILGLLSAGQSRMLRHQRVWRAAQRFWRTASYRSSRRRGRLSGTFVTWSRLALLLQVTNTRTSSTKYQRFISSSFSQLKMQTRILYLWS